MAKIVVFTLICISLSYSASSQTPKLDSLNALLQDAKGPQKGHLLVEIALVLPDEEAIEQLRRMINEYSDSVLLARAFFNLGAFLYNQQRFQESEEVVKMAISLFENNPNAKNYVEGMYSTYAKLQLFRGDYSSSFENFHKCLSLVRSRNDSLMQGSLFIDIGFLYYKVRNNIKALEFYSKGMDLLKHNRSVQFLGNMNSSLCLSELGFPSRALPYCDKAFTLANDDDRNLLHAEFAKGFALLKLGCLEDAAEMFASSLRRSVAVEDVRMEAENSLYLSKTWIGASMFDSTIHALNHAELLANENHFREILLDTYRGFIRIARERNEFSQLTNYQQKYIELKDQVYNTELEQAQASFLGDWYEHQNRQVINFLKLELEQGKAMAYQQWISIVLYVIILLMISIIVIYLRGLYLQQQSQKLLENQVHSRVGTLKRLSRASSTLGDERHEIKSRELSLALNKYCRDLTRLLKKIRRRLPEETLMMCVARIKTAHSQRLSAVSRNLPCKKMEDGV